MSLIEVRNATRLYQTQGLPVARLHVEAIEAVHPLGGIDAVEKGGDHALSLDMVL
jgi:hypothetical protein